MFCAKCGGQVESNNKFCGYCGVEISKQKVMPGFDSVEAISVVDFSWPKPKDSTGSITENIEYILQRKATEHKYSGRMDLAIACLRRSNELMPQTEVGYQASEYMRLVKYLEKDGQHEEAVKEEERIRRQYPDLFKPVSEKINEHNLSVIANILSDGQDLVDINGCCCGCSKCAIYQDRVYSITGNDKRFPVLPEEIRKIGAIHSGSLHAFYPLAVEYLLDEYMDIAVEKSNRPFVDNRTEERIKQWDAYQKEIQEEINDRDNYAMLSAGLPGFCPKSFGAFRRAKNTNSKSYIILTEKAKDMQLDLS